MTDIAEMVEWLKAQLDEDKWVAREAPQDNDVWQAVPTGRYSPAAWVRAVGNEDAWMVGEVSTLQQARHIALHDPASVQSDIAAKRKILSWAERWMPIAGMGGVLRGEVERLVKIMAEGYDKRPGYREEWRPEPSAARPSTEE